MAENGEKVAKKIILIVVDILSHVKKVNFNIIRISTYDAVLGLLWLEKHNPTINYRERTMVFNDCGCRPTKDTDIKEILVRVMNAYFK
jgi:hypothetical protein